MQYLLTKVSLVLLLVVVLEASPGHDVPYAEKLEEAFKNRALVEASVLCFEGKGTCSSFQTQIKEKAQAMIKHGGDCPTSVCSAEEFKNMKYSMDLLKREYRDLFERMMAAMLNPKQK